MSRKPLTARTITPIKSTRQSTPTGDWLEHLPDSPRCTAGGIEATVNRCKEVSHATPGTGADEMTSSGHVRENKPVAVADAIKKEGDSRAAFKGQPILS